MMRSIRSRLTVQLIAGTGLLIVAAGIVLQLTIARWLEREFDRGLEAKARALATLTKERDDRVALEFADALMPEFESSEDSQYFELWVDGTQLLARSQSFDADPSRAQASLPREAEPSDSIRFLDVRLPDGRSGRRARLDFLPQMDDDSDSDSDAETPASGDAEAAPSDEQALDEPGESELTSSLLASVLVARERVSLDLKMSRLRWSMVAFTAVLLSILAALIAFTLGVGLRPLDQLADQVHGLEADTLDRRIALDQPPRELAPVVGRINELLARLETAFRRERQLTSDIAHELKTPIAELRSLSEVGGRWPDDTAAARSFFEDARAIGLQMEQVVGHLLALARVEEGAEPVHWEQVDVGRLLLEAWQPLKDRALERGLVLDNQVPVESLVRSDRAKLHSIVSNLLSNAVEYSVPKTVVSCRFTTSDRAFSLDISNQPADLDAADLEAMFERFWRKDAARSGGRNVGLGLAIANARSRLLGLELRPRLDADHRLVITLTGSDSGSASG